MDTSRRDAFRYFLKDYIRQEIDFRQTDQSLGRQPPPLEKPHDPDTSESAYFQLPYPDEWQRIDDFGLVRAIRERKSHRVFRKQSLSIEELAFLLWATQGIRQIVNAGTALRTVPSAGARHAFETYLCIQNIEGLAPGIYRYLPVDHQLMTISNKSLPLTPDSLRDRLTDATYGQSFAGRAPVAFIWSVIPYRMEWRYGLAAHKVIALDAGHVCQNLYLAVHAVGCGACAIAAYNQMLMDQLINVDGEEEFAIYMAVAGKI